MITSSFNGSVNFDNDTITLIHPPCLNREGVNVNFLKCHDEFPHPINILNNSTIEKTMSTILDIELVVESQDRASFGFVAHFYPEKHKRWTLCCQF